MLRSPSTKASLTLFIEVFVYSKIWRGRARTAMTDISRFSSRSYTDWACDSRCENQSASPPISSKTQRGVHPETLEKPNVESTSKRMKNQPPSPPLDSTMRQCPIAALGCIATSPHQAASRTRDSRTLYCKVGVCLIGPGQPVLFASAEGLFDCRRQ